MLFPLAFLLIFECQSQFFRKKERNYYILNETTFSGRIITSMIISGSESSIYLFGGVFDLSDEQNTTITNTPNEHLWKLDDDSNQWEIIECQETPPPRIGGVLIRRDSTHLILTSGLMNETSILSCKDSCSYLSDVFEYDCENNRFSLLVNNQSMVKPEGRMDPVVWERENSFLYYAGISIYDDYSQNLINGTMSVNFNDLWEFNYTENVWEYITYENDSLKENVATEGLSGSVVWKGSNESFYFFGGKGLDTQTMFYKTYSVCYKFTYGPMIFERLFGGFESRNTNYDNNVPGSFSDSLYWINTDYLYFYGGFGWYLSGEDNTGLTDLWRMNLGNFSFEIVIKNVKPNYPAEENFPGVMTRGKALVFEDRVKILGFDCSEVDSDGINKKSVCEDESNNYWEYYFSECNGIISSNISVCSSNGLCIDNLCVCQNTSNNSLIAGEDCEEIIGPNGYYDSNLLSFDYEIIGMEEDNVYISCENIIQPITLLGINASCILKRENKSLSVFLGDYSKASAGDTFKIFSISNRDLFLEITAEMYYESNFTLFFVLIGSGLFLVFVLIIVFLVMIFLFWCIYKIHKQMSIFKSLEAFDILETCKEELSVLNLNDFNKNYSSKFSGESGRPSFRISMRNFEIKYDDIDIINLIDEGGSGTSVFLVKYAGDIAVYKSFFTTGKNHSEFLENFEKEINITANLVHVFILRFLGCVLSPPRIGMLTEYCEYGNLVKFYKTFVAKNGFPVPMVDKLRILWEQSTAIEFVHSKDVIHRDIKPQNIGINGSFNSKLMDFGLSLSDYNPRVSKKRKKKQASLFFTAKILGTSDFMAPEITLASQISNKIDVFSFSILIYCCLTGNFTPYGNTCFNIEYQVATDSNYRPFINPSDFRECPKNVVNLMKDNWCSNPEKRSDFSTISKILKSEYERLSIATKDNIIQESVKKSIGIDRKSYYYFSKKPSPNPFDISQSCPESTDDIIIPPESSATIPPTKSLEDRHTKQLRNIKKMLKKARTSSDWGIVESLILRLEKS